MAKARVSEVAGLNAVEFVAEVFAAPNAGKQSGEEIMDCTGNIKDQGCLIWQV